MNQATKGAEPLAWYVYVAEHQTAYAVIDEDDAQLMDDATNHDAEITPLYDHPSDQSARIVELERVLRDLVAVAEIDSPTYDPDERRILRVAVETLVGHQEAPAEPARSEMAQWVAG